jgi:Rha family phage regulatory protein
MSQSTAVTLPTDAVFPIDGQAFTTSLTVASVFNRKHYNVLRDIRDLECSPGFRSLNIEAASREVPGPNNATRAESYFRLTRDGTTFLIFGYTGRLAAQFKEAYITAFNALEAQLHQHAPDVVAQIQAELLRSNPLLAKVHRYDRLGLSEREIARLINRSHDTVGRQRARLTRCGLRPAA